MNFWKDIETKAFDPDSLKQVMENIKNQSNQMPTYTVCLEDWKKIKTLADKESITYFSAYLKLLNAGKVRPAFTV